MKLGKLNFKNYAARKPISMSPAGKMLTAKEILAEPSLRLGSVLALDKEQQVDLAIKRYSLEPDFRLGIIGVGILTKKEIMDHIKRQDEFGQVALQAEMGYCNELVANLRVTKLPTWPVVPNPPIPGGPDWKPVKPRCVIFRLKNRALFCENTTDSVTKPFANYRIANVHPKFTARGFTAIVLSGVDDIRAKFIPEAKNTLTVYISGVGHGAYTLYTGHHGDTILQKCQYDSAEVSKKAIHFLSCQTAGQLGPDTVAKGAYCYAGYTENFHLVWDNSATPVDEFLLFAKSDSTFDIMMASGATAKQAFDATIQAFNAALAQPGIPGSAAGTWLAYDRDHFKLLGVESTKIYPFRYVKVCFPLVDRQKEDALVQAGVVVNG